MKAFPSNADVVTSVEKGFNDSGFVTVWTDAIKVDAVDARRGCGVECSFKLLLHLVTSVSRKTS